MPPRDCGGHLFPWRGKPAATARTAPSCHSILHWVRGGRGLLSGGRSFHGTSGLVLERGAMGEDRWQPVEDWWSSHDHHIFPYKMPQNSGASGTAAGGGSYSQPPSHWWYPNPSAPLHIPQPVVIPQKVSILFPTTILIGSFIIPLKAHFHNVLVLVSIPNFYNHLFFVTVSRSNAKTSQIRRETARKDDGVCLLRTDLPRRA